MLSHEIQNAIRTISLCLQGHHGGVVTALRMFLIACVASTCLAACGDEVVHVQKFRLRLGATAPIENVSFLNLRMRPVHMELSDGRSWDILSDGL